MSDRQRSPQSTGSADPSHCGVGPRTVSVRAVGAIGGLLAATAVWFAMPSVAPAGVEGFDPAGARAVAAVAVLMAIWWTTQAIPIPATALVPLAAFPTFGVASIQDAATPYANKVIFLFLGGFMLAIAMQRWQLHRRIALVIVLAVGTRPRRLIFGFMVATALLSMWVSNTATAVMMLPIGASVLALLGASAEAGVDKNFATSLMLGIAYAASIGSIGTIIGTPPNALLIGYLDETYGMSISFGQWMAIATPMAAVFLMLGWLVLTRAVFPSRVAALPGGRELIAGELRAMGRMGRPEAVVLAVFASAALAWIVVPLVWPDGPITDEVIAIYLALALFLLPAFPRKGVALLDWDSAVKLPWGVLLLFGGGLSLAAQITDTGIAAWIGDAVGRLGALPLVGLVAAAAAVVVFLTEVTSNTATAATFLPIMGSVATGLGLAPITLTLPVALAATCAFMLPVATPPNAIAFGSGHVDIGSMARAGVWLNLISIVLITMTTFWAAGVVLE